MSDIISIFFLIFLGYSNSARAKQKGLNGILWAFITIVAFIVLQGIGLLIVISCFCQDVVDMSIFSKNINNFQQVSKQFNQQVETALLANPLREMTVFLFGLGGFLLVRYILDRKPGKKEPEAHWMDKLGERNTNE